MTSKLQIALLLAAAGAVSGCAAPTRADPEHFRSRDVGMILKTAIPAFGDCVLDGFNPLQGIAFSRRKVQQQRRSTGLRIDTLVADGTILLVSVDVGDDGRVEFFESTFMRLSNKEPEFEVFSACKARSASPQPAASVIK